MRMKKSILVLTLALAGWFVPAWAATYGISLGEGQGEPGQIGSVPVYLDTAADVASIEFQLNYDPSLLAVVGVTNPPDSLGEAFDVDYEAEDGRLIVRLFRMDGLVGGNGLLCRVLFQVNAGAEPALWCDLALADAGLSTQFGADLGWRNAIAAANNKFWATFSSTNDADGDGLSDYEEQMRNGSADYVPGAGDTAMDDSDTDGDGMEDGWEAGHGLDPLANDSAGDADGDGLTNAQEAQLGLNPTNADTDGDGYDDRSELIAGTGAGDGNDFLALAPAPDEAGLGRTIFSWRSATGRIYSVRSATNLLAWDAVPLLVVPGDGTDMTFTNPLPLDAQLYYRLEVERE